MPAPVLDHQDVAALEALLQQLKDARGFDFTGYKRTSLTRRVLVRMKSVGCKTFAEYADYLEVHQEEFTPLFNAILINVTAFFRDEATWSFMASDVVPRLLASRGADTPIRVWSAGCATGEEPYTLAMLLCEALGADEMRRRVKIYATDADEEALDVARSAMYPERVMAAVPPGLRERYFETVNGGAVFRSDLRRQMIFGRHDLIQDAPISRVDLLSCRNTLMYFNAETQSRILERFRFALNEGGYLVLGRAETLSSRIPAFEPVDVRRRISVKVSPSATAGAPMRGRPAPPQDPAMEDRQLHAIRSALDASPVATVVVDPDDVVIVANERARLLFALAASDLGRRLQDLRLSYRPVELRSLVEQVRADRRSVAVREIAWVGGGATDQRWFDLELSPLDEPESSRCGVVITFVDVTASKRLHLELENSHQELETAYEELQSTNEELETTNEELQSTVEELETTNEELQSTNEEMETMNQELQSTNEELEATNGELDVRGYELNELSFFFESILSSLSVCVIVVDMELQVRAWNRRAEELWGARRDEVLGRNIFNLDVGMPLEELRTSLREALAGTMVEEHMVLKAVSRRSGEMTVSVHITRLDGSANHRSGAIIAIELVDAPSGDDDTRPQAEQVPGR